MTPTLKLLYDRCEEVGDCRIWTQGTTKQGAPIISLSAAQRGKSVRRLVYSLAKGEVRAGFFVSPKCGQMRCISEHCLTQRTKSEYMQAASRRGAYEHNPMACHRRALAARARSKLAGGMDTAREIRAARAAGATLTLLADKHGVSRDAISKISRGLMWREAAPGSSVFARGAG